MGYSWDWFAYLYKTKTTNNEVTMYKMSFSGTESSRRLKFKDKKIKKETKKIQNQKARKTEERSQVLYAITQHHRNTWDFITLLLTFATSFRESCNNTNKQVKLRSRTRAFLCVLLHQVFHDNLEKHNALNFGG